MKGRASTLAIVVIAALAAPAVLGVGPLRSDAATQYGTWLSATPSPTGVPPEPIGQPTADPRLPVFVTDPAPIFRPTGGPYIPLDQAIKIAQLRVRQTPPGKSPDAQPIIRQAAALLTYGDIVAWSGGSRTHRIDLKREVYLVVMSTRYVPKHTHGAEYECRWVGIVVDATDGTAWALHCGREPWPTTVPPGLVAP